MSLRPLWICNSFSAGTVFRRHNLTSVDVRFWRLKTVSRPERVTITKKYTSDILSQCDTFLEGLFWGLVLVPISIPNLRFYIMFIVWYQVWRLIIRLYICTVWSLDLFIRVPFRLHGEYTYLQPFRRIVDLHIAIPVLPGTHFRLSQVECLAQGSHQINVPILRGEKHDISLKILLQTGFETTRQSATSSKRYGLSIAPCPSHICMPCGPSMRNGTSDLVKQAVNMCLDL